MTPAEPPVRVEDKPVDVAAEPPSVAFLYVQDAADQARYRIWGTFGGSSTLEETSVPLPSETWREGRARTLSGEERRRLMAEYSHGRRELRAWLREVRRRAPELQLVIGDLSSAAIPWELFKLRDEGHDYLGAMVTTTRWMADLCDGDGESVPLPLGGATSEGFAVCHLDSDEAARLAARPSAEAIGEPLNEIRQLAERLKRQEDDCALLYLFCHGFPEPNAIEIALGPKARKNERLTLAELREECLPLLALSGPVVFINACESGRLVRDTEMLRDEARRGFPEVFLAKGARGVIATVDEVSPDLAAEVGDQFFQRVTGAAPVAVAALLRDLRRAAVEQWSQDRDAERLWTVFQYVYYGSPDTRLWIRPRKGDR